MCYNNYVINNKESDKYMGKIYEKIKSKASVPLSDKMAVITPNGVETFDSMDDYEKQVRDSLKSGAEALVKQMTIANVDLTLVDSPTFRPESYTVGGKKFNIDIHCNNRASKAIANYRKADIKSVIQLWNGSQSMIIPFDAETLADARLNWNNDLVIKEKDILSQTVAALRLMSNNPAAHHIAMFLAYGDITKSDLGRKEMDAAGIWRVWD